MAEPTESNFFVKNRVFAAVAVSTVIGVSLMVMVPPREFLRQDVNLKSEGKIMKSSSSSTKPSFVFILADDLAWNSLDYDDFDLTFVSPELSALADDGIKMTNYYALEYCNPSRASLLTGRYPVNMGMQYGVVEYYSNWGLRLGETLLPEILKDEGYSTYAFGKWHLGHFNEKYLPTARGFDTWTGETFNTHRNRHAM
jgi:arylsulfatase A-like enzyme